MAIRSRKEVVAYANKLLNGPQSVELTALKHGCWHIGFVEVKLLLDYIYQEEPKDESEFLIKKVR